MKNSLLLVLFTLSTGLLTAQQDRVEIRQGNRYFYREKFDLAELEYRRALERDSSSFTAHYNMSNALYKQKEYEKAENELKERAASFLEPSQRADAYHNLGNMFLYQKKYAESIESYKDALRLRPNDIETKQNLAYAQKMLENQDQEQDGEGEENDDEQDQNQDQNQDQKDQKQDPKEQKAPPKISPQDARLLLEAIQQKERETQEKVNEEKAKSVSPPLKKNW